MPTSKSCWAGMERHIAKLLGTSRQYGQSAKGSRFKDPSMLGDVKTDDYLIECKLRDYAPRAFRVKHPRKFYPKFSVKNEWWKGIIKEAAIANRIPVLVIKPKYGQDDDMIVMMREDELPYGYAPKIQPNAMHKILKSSVSLRLDSTFPWGCILFNEWVVALPFQVFLDAVRREDDPGTTG